MQSLWMQRSLTDCFGFNSSKKRKGPFRGPFPTCRRLSARPKLRLSYSYGRERVFTKPLALAALHCVGWAPGGPKSVALAVPVKAVLLNTSSEEIHPLILNAP